MSEGTLAQTLAGEATCLYRDELAEVWHGDALDSDSIAHVMGDRKADAIVCDCPYSSVTHSGHRDGKLTADRAAAFAARPLKDRLSRSNSKRERDYSARKSAAGESGRRDIDYPPWSPADVDRFVELWAPRCSGWLVSITDDVLSQAWRAAYEVEGLVTFASLPLVETGSRVRMSGDGPSAWSCFVMVARPRGKAFQSWGTLPGAYIVPGERDQNSADGTDRIVGGKPKRAMIAIVSDYSREGDLVVDPTCGAATTGIAALRTGRRFVGIEKDRATAELAAEIIKAERLNTTRRRMVAGQEALFR
ncbi:MAG TPA: DNA methyltransferase [Jiangellaceae bacterium]|nr:DNA methyltransferase [Jiangellaceae bacterium]